MIASAFGWVGKLAEWFGAWIPRLLILKSSHAGVKYVRGKHAREMGPGLHLFWPLVTDYETCPTVRQYVDAQLFAETRDGFSVFVSGVCCYEVRDVLTFLAENENAYDAIDDVVATSIRKLVTSLELQELRRDDAKITLKLTRGARANLKALGVGVLYVRLRDFSRTQVVSLAGQSLVNNIHSPEPVQ